VLRQQLARDPGRIGWDRVDATGDLSAQALAWTARRVAKSDPGL
jgi:hypothetical protein